MTWLLIPLVPILLACSSQNEQNHMKETRMISLPEPLREGSASIEETLQKRRSVREYSQKPLTLQDISQLVWAAQGITDETRGFRTAPSAGATFPLEVYVIITGIDEVPEGVYRYNYREHNLEKKITGDRRRDLYEVSLRQPSIISAPVVMVITGIPARTEQRYGERALRYVYMEAGHVGQNISLQGIALGIGTVVIGAFQDREVSRVLQLAEGEHPLYIMPLGKY
jgi:SagB-type dehydrogenase family enzyme